MGLFFKSGDLAAKQALQASYMEALPLESPWADDSHLETLTLASLYGLTPDNLPVTRSNAMQIACVAKGRNLISTSVARMPLQAISKGQPIANQPAFLKQLEPGVTNFQTLSWITDHLIFHARAFLLITSKTSDGKPSTLRFVPEWHAETKDGALVKAFDKPVKPGEYIRIDANHEGLLNYGSGVLREAQEIEQAAREAGANPVPSLLLQQKEGTELNKTQISEMLASWTASRKKKGGSVAYANKAIDVQSLGKHAEDLLIDARNLGVNRW